MKRIPLTQGLFATVDDEDFEWLNGWRWYAARVGGGGTYAVRREKDRTILMHRQILGLTNSNEIGDHADMDTLNNTRTNLRACSKQQNSFNRGKSRKNTTGFKGVTIEYGYNPQKMKYAAQISNNGRTMRIGSFSTPEEAARAYDEKARELHGEFCRTNF